jgi:hypothetical protein
MMRAWSPAAEDKLRALYATTPMPRLAFLLKRTEKAVRSRAKLLGLRRSDRRPWTPSEDATLRMRYPNEATATIAADLDRRASTVYQRAVSVLGLKKSAEYMASGEACRFNGHDPRSVAHRFKKGQPSWSKGTKGVVGVQAGCRRTQFKRGQMRGAAQHNYVPIGSERISKDGYLERKVTDDPTLAPARRWVGVHRLVWEAANGPVPRGHAVVFLPGRRTIDPQRITVDGLELVTRAELMKRNSYITRYPKPVADAIRLRGAVVRQINRRTRKDKAA